LSSTPLIVVWYSRTSAPVCGARSVSNTTPPIGYSDRSTLAHRSPPHVDCCSNADPNCGCMFCIEPAHGPCSMPRQSPKYFQVSDSGPRGTGGASYPPGATGQPAATGADSLVTGHVADVS